MSLRYDEIGKRLRAFRLGMGLSAEEIARRIGISRTAVYRFEKGEVVKIETLINLADLLGVSLASLLGVEIEYIQSPVTYFERLRQLEEEADRIVVLAGPISYLLSSERFRTMLKHVLVESVEQEAERDRHLADIELIMSILAERMATYEARRPTVVNLISALEIERMLRAGFAGRPFVSDSDLDERRRLARDEVEHFIRILEDEPMGIQIGLVTGTVPQSVFHIFRKGDRKTLAISPFRLGEQPNISVGVATVTASPEAVQLHERMFDDLWKRALKGVKAARFLRDLLRSTWETDG